MHDYAAYGLKIRSQLLLPELVEASSAQWALTPRPQGDADVTISLQPLDDCSSPLIPSQNATWVKADSAFIDYPEAASFLIRGGREIFVHADPEADPALIRLYLLGPVFALLLHQRQFLVLHASAANVGGRAVAFVGEKGMGKSTIAAALLARGHGLVADDLVPVDTRQKIPVAYPGFPQLKLFPESAALLDSEPGRLPKVHPQLEKRARRSVAGFSTAPLPLSRIFVLADADQPAIELLPARLAFMELVRHTYLLAFLKATGAAELHFKQAMAVASGVPVMQLLRPRSLDSLSVIAAMVEGDIERAA